MSILVAVVGVAAAPMGHHAVIPIETYGGNPLARVRVNGSEPLWFLLDTASTWSFLDAAVAKSLGIGTKGGRTIMGGGDNPAAIAFAGGVALDVSGVVVTPDEVAVMPLRFKYEEEIPMIDVGVAVGARASLEDR